MSDSVVEAYDLARHAEQLHERLSHASERLEAQEALEHERSWMKTAETLVAEQLEPVRGLLDRARMLPELSFLRDEVAEEFLNAWVDALEKLQAGITFHAGSRAPVIEALFPPKLKLPTLRRANKEAVEAVAADFERRLKTSYVTRIFGQEEMAFAQGVLEAIRGAYAQYLSTFDGSGLPAEESDSLRTQLLGAFGNLELVTGQAKLLAEAALLAYPGAFDECGLSLKAKKRSSRLEPRAEDQGLTEAEAEELASASEPAPVAEEPAAAPEPAPEAAADEPPAPRKGRKAPKPTAQA